MDRHSKGYHIGHINLTNDTVADDELLVSSSHSDAQTQLDIIAIESSRDRGLLNPIKTEGMVLNHNNIYLEYDGKQVPIKESPKHLGLNLSAGPIKAEAAISKSRKTMYALMGSGSHGVNGINPIIIRKIWQTYNLPRSTHGMEVQILNDIELRSFQQHENAFNKMYQTFPKFAPNILSHILMGGRPATLIIHQKMLTLMMNIQRKEGIEFDIGLRQLAMKKPKSLSWFHRANHIANKYGLPNCYTVFEELPWSKAIWKTTGAIWKTTGASQVGSPHPVYLTLGNSTHAVKQAISKVRFLTDTLMTGVKQNKMFGYKSSCECGFKREDRFHILLTCSFYTDLRQFCIDRMVTVILNVHPWIITETMVKHPYALGHLILDPTWYREDIGSPGKGLPNIMSKKTTDELETIGRTYCFQVYKRRFEILSQKEGDESETDCDDSYSIHDTSSDDSYSEDETEDDQEHYK